MKIAISPPASEEGEGSGPAANFGPSPEDSKTGCPELIQKRQPPPSPDENNCPFHLKADESHLETSAFTGQVPDMSRPVTPAVDFMLGQNSPPTLAYLAANVFKKRFEVMRLEYQKRKRRRRLKLGKEGDRKAFYLVRRSVL